MVDNRKEIRIRASMYARDRGFAIRFANRLGVGNDGWVWPSTRNTAVKAFERERPYQCEKHSYLRLQDAGISQIGRLTVPNLIGYDDERLIVEMTTVSAPYLLDFGKVYFDAPPEYEEGVWEEKLTDQAEMFGHRWPEVQEALDALESIGIYYIDAQPKNIDFGD